MVGEAVEGKKKGSLSKRGCRKKTSSFFTWRIKVYPKIIQRGGRDSLTTTQLLWSRKFFLFYFYFVVCLRFKKDTNKTHVIQVPK